MEDKVNTAVLKSAHATTGVARNVYFIRKQTVLSKSQVAYIGKIIGWQRQGDGSTEATGASSQSSSPERLIAHLKKQCASYCCLYHHAQSEELKENRRPTTTTAAKRTGLATEHHLRPEGVSEGTDGMHVEQPLDLNNSPEMQQLQSFATDNRKTLGISNDQSLMIAIAWVLPAERLQFMLFSVFASHRHDGRNK
jgi:hypothetical protein